MEPKAWLKSKFLHTLTPVTITAMLVTLPLLFSFKGDPRVGSPLTIFQVAIALFLLRNFIFRLSYVSAKALRPGYRDAAPSAMTGASNHLEAAIATATVLFDLSSGAALATVVGVLVEAPVMLLLVRICRC